MLRKLIQNKRNILAYIIGLIVSSSKLFAGATPFGLAILGATATCEVPILIPFVGIALITVIKFGWVSLIKFVISSIIFVLLKSFLKKTSPSKVNETAKMLLAAAIGESILLFFSNTPVYDSLLAIYSSITAGVFYLVFSEGLSVILDYNSKSVVSSEDLISTSVLLTVGISALGNLSIYGISIRGVVSVLLVMILGWKLGPCIGATAGITTSIVLGLMGYGSAVTVATYGFSGLLCGVLSKFGKFGAGIGFILGNMILAFYANGSTEVIISIKEIIVASVFLFAIPKKVSVMMDNLFGYDGSLVTRETKFFEKNTIYRLSAVSEVIDNMTEENESEDNTSEEIRTFMKSVNENACQKCTNRPECWGKNYHAMYETIFNMVEVLQSKGEVNQEDIGEESICINKDILSNGLNFSYQIYKVNQNWQQKIKEQRRESFKQLKQVSNAINNITSSGKVAVMEKPEIEYSLSVGIAKCKKNNSLVSGDNFVSTKLEEGKYLLAISDGMGSGEKANRKSKKVIKMLEKLLSTGFEKTKAVELVNSVMLTSDDSEIFATLDAAIIDLRDGSTEFIKIGSCPTYIKTNKNVDIVQSVTLPVGVLEDIDIDLYGKNLQKGSIIVMLSDGILDANDTNEKKELWVSDLLKAIKTQKPQRIADIILQEAIDLNLGVAKDDMTVIVAKVE